MLIKRINNEEKKGQEWEKMFTIHIKDKGPIYI